MPLAIRWNEGDFYVLALIMLLITISAFLPARFSHSQVVYIVTYNFFLGVIVDQILAAPPYNLYDILTPEFSVGDLCIYLLLYPPFVYIFMFIADIISFDKKGLLFIFLVSWSAFTLFLEWIGSQLNVFNYHDWIYLQSYISYIIIYLSNLFVLFCITIQRKRRSLPAS